MCSNRRITAAGFLGTRTPNSGPNHSKAGKSIGFTTPSGKIKSTSAHCNNMFRSYIIFSERCELKKMFVHSPEVKVMNRNVLFREVADDITYLPEVLSILEINQIHTELSKYALADDATKQAHIDAMRWRN